MVIGLGLFSFPTAPDPLSAKRISEKNLESSAQLYYSDPTFPTVAMEAFLKGGLTARILSVGCAVSTRTLANHVFFKRAVLIFRRRTYSSTNVPSGEFLHHSVVPTMFYQKSLPR